MDLILDYLQQLNSGDLQLLQAYKRVHTLDALANSIYLRHAMPVLQGDIDTDIDMSEQSLDPNPVLSAIQLGDIIKLQELLDAGATLEASDKYLLQAVEDDDYKMVEYLLSKGYTHGINEALDTLVPENDTKMAKLLLVAGADPNAKTDEVILARAITYGNTALVSALLDFGADPMLLDSSLPTFGYLETAVAQYNPYLLDMLLTHGYSTNADRAMALSIEKYHDGKIPEKYKSIFAIMIQLLMEHGVSVDESRLTGIKFNDACAEYTLAKLREVAENAGTNTRTIEGIPKLKDELCFDYKNLPLARKLISEYTFNNDLTSMLVQNVSDRVRLDKLIKGKATFLKRVNDESLHVYATSNAWLDSQKVFLKTHHCFGISYCDFVRGYSHHGDNWISRIMEGYTHELRNDIEIFNSTHDYEHPFYTIIRQLTEKYGVDCPDNDISCDVYAEIMLEIAKNLVHIILTAPVTTEYLAVFRGESNDYPGNAREGDIYTNTRFMSTSVDSNIARKFAQKKRTMRILLPPGSHALATGDCSKFKYEFEIILPPKCTFVVLRSTFNAESDQILDLLLIKQPILIDKPLCANKIFKKEPVVLF